MVSGEDGFRAPPPPCVLWELQLHLGSGQIAWGEVGGDSFSHRDTAASVFGFSLAASVTFWLPSCLFHSDCTRLSSFGVRGLDGKESPAGTGNCGSHVGFFLSAYRQKEQASFSTDHLSMLFPHLLSAHRNRIEPNGVN